MDTLLEIYGAFGAIAILVAYFLNTTGVIATGIVYQTLNSVGAIGITLISVKKRVWAPAALNIAWALIALVGLIQSR